MASSSLHPKLALPLRQSIKQGLNLAWRAGGNLLLPEAAEAPKKASCRKINRRKSLYGPASKAMVLYKMGMVPLGKG